jgi:hypothetical protein
MMKNVDDVFTELAQVRIRLDQIERMIDRFAKRLVQLEHKPKIRKENDDHD